MRLTVLLIMVVLLAGCSDNTRVYEKNRDFEERFWLVTDKPSFDFAVQDTISYSLFCNVRNSVSYPYARIFVTWSLKDSVGNELKREMVNSFLFDQKTGEPLGVSGLGDLYDQRLPLLKNFKFPYTGKYSVQFEQFMRTDSLQGILAVGLRVEKSVPVSK